jgi:hypothetical protein
LAGFPTMPPQQTRTALGGLCRSSKAQAFPAAVLLCIRARLESCRRSPVKTRGFSPCGVEFLAAAAEGRRAARPAQQDYGRSHGL